MEAELTQVHNSDISGEKLKRYILGVLRVQ